MKSIPILLIYSVLLISFVHCDKSDVQSGSDSSFWYKSILKGAGILEFAYDCTGKVDGNYPHPTKCEMYVACVAQTYAYEMPCQLMEDGVTRKHYVAESGPDPAKSYCAPPWLAGCDPSAKPPSACTPSNCKLEGECRTYRQCVAEDPNFPDSGTWASQECGADLFWNPDPEVENCDYFVNLPQDVQDKYESDTACIEPCGFYQEEKDWCSPRYTLRSEFQGTDTDRYVSQTCPEPPGPQYELLYWSPEKLSCDKCSQVTYPDGTPCSCPATVNAL